MDDVLWIEMTGGITYLIYRLNHWFDGGKHIFDAHRVAE